MHKEKDNKTIKVAVSSPSFSKNPLLVQKLRDNFPDSKINLDCDNLEGAALVSFLSDIDAVIVGREIINASVLDKLPKLAFITKYGVGLDNLDLDYIQKKSIAIALSPGTNRRSVAELTLCFLLSLSHKVFINQRNVDNGIWQKQCGKELSKKKLGIIGCGNVGSEIIRLVLPFGLQILVNDILLPSHFTDFFKEINQIYTSLNRQRNKKVIGDCIHFVSKDEIYKSCDFITLHVPLSEQTKSMINSDVFDKMQEQAYLINTSRGKVLDQDSLKQALISKKIAGAALDVLAEEPPHDEELLKLPNLLLTPHIGGSSHEAALAMGEAALEGLISWAKNN